MPRFRKEVNEQIKEERRRLILLSALKVFTRKGYAASKMTDVAEEAKISYGLMYYYFKSKDDIYAELVKHAADASRHLVEEIDRRPIPPVQKIRELASAVFGGLGNKSSSAYYFVLCVEALMSDAAPEPVRQSIGRIMEPLDTLSRIISEGQKANQMKPGDPMDMAVAAFSMVLGLSSMMISGRIDKLPPVEIFCRVFE